MSTAHDSDKTEGADGGSGLDPREAAMLLADTSRQAQRQLALRPPLLTLLGAVVILVAYGAVWLSVRGQQPYTGPSFAALILVYAVLFVMIGSAVKVAQRATTGVSGRSRRTGLGQLATLWSALLGVYAFQGALLYNGASHAIVYGIYPATVPLIVLGTLGAAIAAAREDWPALGVAIAVVLVAGGSAFAGPIGVWAIAGVGCCVAVIGYGVSQIWLLRASR